MTIVGYPGTDTGWAQWHTRYSTRLNSPATRPDPIARHPLGEAPHQLPGLPGTWWIVEERAFLAAKPGDWLEHDGDRIGGIQIFDLVDGAVGPLLRYNNHALEIISRGGQISVQVYAPAD